MFPMILLNIILIIGFTWHLRQLNKNIISLPKLINESYYENNIVYPTITNNNHLYPMHILHAMVYRI